jgi:predicted nucleic acid-binding protein
VSRARARVRETPVASVLVDASVAVAWFVPEAGSDAALALLRSPRRLIAPDFLLVETANALWKRHRRRELHAADADHAMATLFVLGIQWLPARDVVVQAGRLAREIGHPVYDCLYLALARAHDAPLATLDRRVVLAARATDTPLFALKGRA